MIIELYRSSSDPKKVYKNITLIKEATIQLLEDTTIESPNVMIRMDDSIKSINYAYIDSFGRYYYIDSIDIIQGNKARLHLSCDVLRSFFSSCSGSPVIAGRSSSAPDPRIEDPRILKLKEPKILIKNVGLSLPLSSSYNYVLTLTGKGV